MAKGINKVILIGNLGNEPEVRFTADNRAMANFSVATSESWKDKNSGETMERTEWHRVVIFGRLAEIVQQYLHKGSKVYIEGSLRTRKWQDQNGNDRYTTEINANNMQMLDGRDNNQNNSQNSAPQNSMINNEQAPASTQEANNSYEELDDDVPF